MDFWLAIFPGTRSRGKVNGKIDTGFFSHFFLVLFDWIKTLSEKNAVYQLKLKVWKVGPRSHFISRLSLIVRVNVVLNRTVVVDSDWRFDITCAVVIFRVKVVSRQLMVLKSGYWSVLSIKSRCYWSSVSLISRDVIGYEDSWCHWCVSIRVLSQLKSPLLLVQLSVVRSFSRS